MEFGNTKEVMFVNYCPDCKHFDIPEHEDPCDECLHHAFNYDSHKPVNYEENKKSE